MRIVQQYIFCKYLTTSGLQKWYISAPGGVSLSFSLSNTKHTVEKYVLKITDIPC